MTKKIISLLMAIIMIMGMSLLYVSAYIAGSISGTNSWMTVGETMVLTFDNGNSSATWSSSNTSVATVSSSGIVTAVGSGTVNICATPTGSGGVYSEYPITVYDNRGIVEGEEYYIINYTTGKALSLASNSNSNGTDIIPDFMGTETRKQWRLEFAITGVFGYQITSVYTSGDKGVYHQNDDIYLYTADNSTRSTFQIERAQVALVGNEQLVCYVIRRGTSYLSHNTGTNTICMTTTLNDSCYWTLSRVDKGDAELYSFCMSMKMMRV